MLTEHLIASIGVPLKPPGTHVAKDAAIFLHEFQPVAAQRSIWKKSATQPNCLAVSETHIYAAQSDKAVVHVYSREKGNQEATVPFPERITALVLACDDAVLVLGTAEGRIFAWEVASGRLVTSAQAHLQAVTDLVVDIKSNFLLSASQDSTVHVWSLPDFLSFANTQGATPTSTFSHHRAAVVALALGHSASHCNFVISACADKTCLVWDYRTNGILRTYLLPGVPTSLVLDPADRAFYVGFDDGSVQQIDLHANGSKTLEAVQNARGATHPIQPAASTRWNLPDTSHGSVLSMALSFDSTTLITGHHSGSVLTWDVHRGNYLSNLPHTPFPGPVSNLQLLPVSGFYGDAQPEPSRFRVLEITKPKFGSHLTDQDGQIPGNYALNVQFTSELPSDDPPTAIQQALHAESFPAELLDAGLAELASWGKNPSAPANGGADDSDFVSFNDASPQMTLEQENAELKRQLEALRRVQVQSLHSVQRLSDEKRLLVERVRNRASRQAESDAEMSSVDESG